MRRHLAKLLALALVSTTVLGGVADAASVRTVVKPYQLGFVGEVTVACATYPDTGGACFGLNIGETSVTVTIEDDEGWPIQGFYWFRDAIGRSYTAGYFCDSGTFDIPIGATRLSIYLSAQGVFTYEPSLSCGLDYRPATSGTITAEFVDP